MGWKEKAKGIGSDAATYAIIATVVGVGIIVAAAAINCGLQASHNAAYVQQGVALDNPELPSGLPSG